YHTLVRAHDQRLIKAIETCIDVRTATVNVVVGADPIVEQLLHAPTPSGPAKQDEKDRDANWEADGGGDNAFEAEERGRQVRNEPSADGEQNDGKDRKQKKARVALVRDDVAKHRAGDDEVEIGACGLEQPQRERPGEIAAHD